MLAACGVTAASAARTLARTARPSLSAISTRARVGSANSPAAVAMSRSPPGEMVAVGSSMARRHFHDRGTDRAAWLTAWSKEQTAKEPSQPPARQTGLYPQRWAALDCWVKRRRCRTRTSGTIVRSISACGSRVGRIAARGVEGHGDVEAAVGSGVCGDLGVVGLGDGSDDGESESVAARVCPVRGRPACWNGWKSRSILVGGTVGPVLATVMVARPGAEMMETSMFPSGVLWRRALLSMRLAMRHSIVWDLRVTEAAGARLRLDAPVVASWCVARRGMVSAI